MSRTTWNIDHGPFNRLYRDRENGWIFGVCAGVADYLNFRIGVVRLLTFISLFLFFWPVVLCYLAATVLIREKPLIYSGRDAERDFWRRSSCHHWSHR